MQGFLSTLSLRRATALGLLGWLRVLISIHALLAESDLRLMFFLLCGPLFLSTLSLRRATHYDNYNLHCVEISIHALLAESDVSGGAPSSSFGNFYPRSPCGERHIGRGNYCHPPFYFYPRSPCGERRYGQQHWKR